MSYTPYTACSDSPKQQGCPSRQLPAASIAAVTKASRDYICHVEINKRMKLMLVSAN